MTAFLSIINFFWHLVYGAADCSGAAAQYMETTSDEAYCSHNFFARLHQRLAETGSFETAGSDRLRTARTPAVNV